MATLRRQALVVFDLDGTLLRGPTVCEVLAQSLSRLPRMQQIERLRERQDMAAAREEMALWYRDVPRPLLIDALGRVQMAPGLDQGISMLQAHGVAVGIASITWDFAVQHFADRWGIEHYLATTLRDGGAIDHVWTEHKASWVLDLSARLGVPRERTAAIGDSAGDHAMLGVVGTPIFVGTGLPLPEVSCLHWPAANIEHVCRHLIDKWKL